MQRRMEMQMGVGGLSVESADQRGGGDGPLWWQGTVPSTCVYSSPPDFKWN